MSRNIELSWLNCIANQLTSLDVSYNIDLEYLNCIDNQLTSLDLTKNRLLIRVMLKGNPGDWWKEIDGWKR